MFFPLDFPAVIGPMKQSLPLPSSAEEIPLKTVVFYLIYMTLHFFPAVNLTSILVFHASAPIVTAVPLEPAARIGRMDPTLCPPNRKWLTCPDAKVVKRWIISFRRKFCLNKPAVRKFVARIGHVLSAEYTQFKHLFGSQLRFKIGRKVPPRRFFENVPVALLHLVMNNDGLFSHNQEGYTLPVLSTNRAHTG